MLQQAPDLANLGVIAGGDHHPATTSLGHQGTRVEHAAAVGNIRFYRGGSRVLRITSYNVCYTKLLRARGDREIEEGARPILMLEDPESRLHPTMLALVWGLLEQVPGQKILTTNSGDLLSALPLNQIRRLVRHPDRTRAYQLNDAQLSGSYNFV